ncbi:hypothetical protein EV196_10721 [Mariniflexile fucanivorans]|uniref:Uncharacterized protein n=1 Tax=Mariniflexile fucanivorans TaxID=264023 RepID=A0A4R1REL7_9FLAO|nr:hypothetical protein [Mariniflexile fucanivorans]TCL64316.1 hypothetical protein EV196_10721 [Mariniflexile fucanivorans]
MIKQLFTYTYIVILINSMCLSCSKPVDFDQVNDLEITPVMESSLVYLNQPATSFLNDGNQISTVQDYVQVQFFNSDFIVDNLVKAEFVFETTNSINSGFQVKVDFLDVNSQLQHSFSFLVEASTNNLNTTSNFTEVFQDNTLLALKNTSMLVFTLKMLSGTPVTQNTVGYVSLKSKGVFYFNIDADL